MKELDLKKFLKKYGNKNVDFYRFPGNYGDSLIWHGTMILLSTLNISVDYIDVSSEKQINSVLFIDGGGNFVDYYSDVKNFLLKNSGLYEEIVILPHTIFGETQIDILSNLLSNLTVFCREKVSANFLEKNLKKGSVYLWHDCAFYNTFSDKIQGEGILNAFRVDKESIIKNIPECNHDISYKGYAMMPLDNFINTLNVYKEINTDRLHVAIGGVLLGKQVNLFSNSYYKNKAVFEYSLKGFSNISFIDSNQMV